MPIPRINFPVPSHRDEIDEMEKVALGYWWCSGKYTSAAVVGRTTVERPPLSVYQTRSSDLEEFYFIYVDIAGISHFGGYESTRTWENGLKDRYENL